MKTKIMKNVLLVSTIPLLSMGAINGLAATDLSLWYHGAGNPVEAKIIDSMVDDFNKSQSEWKVTLQGFPQESYNDSVIAAALAGNLPDILDVDGPVMPNWAWAGYLQPLNIDSASIEDFLPGTKGYWDGQLYSLGLWDAGVAMISRKSTLVEANIRIPTLAQPWTLNEFNAALETLKQTGQYDYPFDPGLAWKGEWFPYAFSPFLQSFGGDIIDRDTYQTAEGVLNGDAAIAFGEWWQMLFQQGYSPGNSQDTADRETGLIDGKYAIQWNGNWIALNMLKAFGDDVLFLPAPDFGHGPKMGASSWQFGVSSSTSHPQGAADFIQFASQDRYLTAFSDAIGLIPPTKAAADASQYYQEGSPMATFFELSAQQAVLRPVTPGYVVAAKVFEKALADIADGADVIDTLDNAADEINNDIRRNLGYGH
ncbi:extracellular solute-binding protein [Marinomonas sp. M1K-6]|uniref:Extracellular solute-binding protein n=1 Tax=Marinomonas profundi TaxID=2726122 RepID=A0A847R0H6_9GAMM|nr:extracellular solute-binding protein [Marinomonas profundi]NLQ16985.1 extracellular solute-binding protein [Marinomonas profundi]UDV02710.1 extracellular solute-binding protein [Marinomonas profundi]